jgi:hypothetical protein
MTRTAGSNPALALFDLAVPASEQLQTHALDRAPTATGEAAYYNKKRENFLNFVYYSFRAI